MSRKCKCQIDKRELNTDTAYKVVKNGRNLYYCNEKEYLNWLDITTKNNEEKNELFKKIGELLYGIDSSVLYKGIDDLHKKYSYKLMTSYLYEYEDMLEKAMNKQFVSTFAKIKYFLAILRNNLVDYEIPIDEEIKYIEHEIVETKYKCRNKRRSLAEIESEVLENIE